MVGVGVMVGAAVAVGVGVMVGVGVAAYGSHGAEQAGTSIVPITGRRKP
jgi:hypothetical protein